MRKSEVGMRKMCVTRCVFRGPGYGMNQFRIASNLGPRTQSIRMNALNL
jgi:hypothetical protein